MYFTLLIVLTLFITGCDKKEENLGDIESNLSFKEEYESINNEDTGYGKTYRESEYYLNGLSLLSKVLEDNAYANTSSVTIKGLSSDYPYLVPYAATQLFTATNRDDTHIGRGNDLSDTYTYSYYLKKGENAMIYQIKNLSFLKNNIVCINGISSV